MIDENELKERLDEISYSEDKLVIEENTYETALRYLPNLAKYLEVMPELSTRNSSLFFKFGDTVRGTLEISGTRAELLIKYGDHGPKRTFNTFGSDFDPETLSNISSCR